MSRADLVIRGERILGPGGEQPLSVAVRAGRIAGLAPYRSPPPADETVNLDPDTVLLPGLVDGHVHVNEPGRTGWEGFTTATRAAAAGGVTTILDMPLNSVPPTVDVAALRVKRRAAAQRCHVDVGFFGGAIPSNLHDLVPLHQAGVFGVKCFLSPSGVDEFPALSTGDLIPVLRQLATCDGLLLVHAELPDHLTDPPVGDDYGGFLTSRPALAEQRAVEAVVEALRAVGGRAHIVHLTSAGAAGTVATARADGLRITAETCPHYLTFTADDVPAGATEFKCCPPIRHRDHQDALWRALAAGTVDYVASDHSPCPGDLKAGTFRDAWGGIASLQLLLPATWTAARQRGHTLAEVVTWLARRPARALGLTDRGEIAPGRVANLCAFAPDLEWVVDPAQLHHRHPITPYRRRQLSGVVRQTWLRGVPVPSISDRDAAGDRRSAAAPRGRLLTSPPRPPRPPRPPGPPRPPD